MTPEEILAMLRRASQGGGGFEDPEYNMDLADLQTRLGRTEAEYTAGETGTRARYGTMLREAEQQHPNDLRQAAESAAGRGMLYSGGRLEEDSRLRKGHADYIAKAGQSQADELNSLLRGVTNQREDISRGVGSAMQSASQRALLRAREARENERANRLVEPEVPVAPVAPTPIPAPVARTAPVAAPGAYNPKNATLVVKGVKVTTNAAGIISSGPYKGLYPSQVR